MPCLLSGNSLVPQASRDRPPLCYRLGLLASPAHELVQLASIDIYP